MMKGTSLLQVAGLTIAFKSNAESRKEIRFSRNRPSYDEIGRKHRRRHFAEREVDQNDVRY